MWSTPIRPTSLFLASQVVWGRWCRQLQTGGCLFHQPGLPIVVSHSIIGRQQNQTSVILLGETCCCEWDFALLSQLETWALAGGQRQAVYLMLLYRPVGLFVCANSISAAWGPPHFVPGFSFRSHKGICLLIFISAKEITVAGRYKHVELQSS